MTKNRKRPNLNAKIETRKHSCALACLWNAADVLGQYSKILENIRSAAPVR